MTEAAKKPRGRPRDVQKREAILDAARTLFLAQGPEVTTDEVITLACVAKATLYANFKDKEDLIEAVIRRESETIMAHDLTSLAGASFEKKIWDVGYRWVKFVNHTDVVGWERLISHSARRHSQLPHRFFNAGPGRWFALLKDLLETAAQAGKFPKLDSARAAEDLVGLWLGFSSLQLRLGDTGPMSDLEVRKRVRHGLQVFSVAYGLHDQWQAAAFIQNRQAEHSAVSEQGDDSEPRAASASARVWLDLDQEQLDMAYNPSACAPNLDVVMRRCKTNTKLVRSRLGEPARIAYGDSPYETLELTHAKRERAPVHIFVHGGAWKGSNAAEWGFLAENFVNRGIHFVAPDFINVLQTGGSLAPMVDQVRRSVAWVYRHAESFGADPHRIYLSGHSSGAHLAAMALVTDWQAEYGLPADIIKGAVLVSGIYDLKPVRLSFRRSYVTFDEEVEERLSPQRHLNMLDAPVVIVNGMMESSEFVRQSKDFADAIGRAGKSVRLITGQEYNHFEIVETLGNPFGLAGAAALNQAGS